MNFKSDKLKPVVEAVKRSVELVNEGNPAEAVKASRWAIAEAGKLGVTSAAIFWHAAVANDYAGNWEDAFENITRALALDPLAEPYRRSFTIIADRIRAALTAEDRAADDPSTPRLYDLVLRAGEATAECHAAMARYALATGDVGKAKAIADATALLHPAAAMAWKCKAEVAAKLDDTATVQACAVELAALGESFPLFAVPGVAMA